MSDHSAYDQEFYTTIIAERRKLGSNGYVDIDKCMETMGREYSPSMFQNETVENERA